jgi:T-complex protein 11
MDGRIDPRPCRSWYDEARQGYSSLLHSSNIQTSLNTHDSLIHGVITTLFSASELCALPKSFQFDLKRLERLRTDLQDMIHLKMSLLVFDELRIWLTSGQATSVPCNTYTELQSRILAIVDEQPNDDVPWQASSANVALEIARAACAFCGHSEVIIPDRLIQRTFSRLSQLICRQTYESNLRWESAKDDLMSRTTHYARIFNDMTPLAMSEAQQQWQQQQEQSHDFWRLPDIEDIGRRLAHVGILHWKIWANLVYVGDGQESPPELPRLVSQPSHTKSDERAAMMSDLHSSTELVVE